MRRDARQAAVDVQRALQLEEIPLFNEFVHLHSAQSIALNDIVEEDDLAQLDGQIVLVP